MRTVDEIKTNIKFVKQNIKECKERGDNTWITQMLLEEVLKGLQQKERDLHIGGVNDDRP